jgi:hypothetical protein
MNTLGSPPMPETRARKRDALWVPFFIPILIGPPAAIVGELFGWGWLGLAVALGGTFMVVQDALRSQGTIRLAWLRSSGLAVMFCAIWIAIGWGVLAGVAALIPQDAYNSESGSGELADKDSNLD